MTPGAGELELLCPAWPAPANVAAVFTTRQGGCSADPWCSFNLGTHVGDRPADVAENRKLLQRQLAIPEEPRWLQQVHGTDVILQQQNVRVPQVPPEADASYSLTPGLASVILTADCLPVLLCDRAGSVVGAAHAGWRGLAAGVLGNLVQAMAVPSANLIACLGPAISQPCFEVGPEVRQIFLNNARNSCHRDDIAKSFLVSSGRAGHWLADLYSLARAELRALGVTAVYGGDYCTYREAKRFYSYRRDGLTGRMASLIWLKRS